VRKAIKADVCCISMDTDMDNARGGVKFEIAERLGLMGGMGPISAQEKIPMVVAELPQPLEAQAFIELVKERFGVKCAMCNELLQRPISKVAICGGAGDFMLDEAIAKGADAFITGEMHYHVYFGHEQQIQICVIGHYESEQFTSEIFRDIIEKACPGLRTVIAETNTNPIRII
jgi:putative NIF3 family GTP cyclohydrolase 1 type 2